MEICFLANMISKIDAHSRHRVNFFIKKGYKVSIITYPTDEIKESENVKIYFIKKYPVKFLTVLLNMIKVRRIIKKINPDILHAYYAGVNGALASLSGFHPYFLTVYGSDILVSSKSMFARLYIKYILKKADIITCDGNNSSEKAINLGVDPQKIRMINFGVDVDKFKSKDKNLEMSKKLKISDSSTVISLRNFYQVYDMPTLIKAIPLVLRKLSSVNFLIVGDGPEKNKLIKLAESLNVYKNIRFVGMINQEDIVDLLNLADVYISTSLSDSGISLSTAEAMACGIPPIITDVADNRYWIKEGENGFLFPACNSKKLAEKIVYVLRNKGLRKMISENTRQSVVEKNNYYIEMAKMEKIYKEVINK
jgi:glycosyltransferase involved in cell wall biosynthesis